MSKTDEQQADELSKQKEFTAFATHRRNADKRAITCPCIIEFFVLNELTTDSYTQSLPTPEKNRLLIKQFVRFGSMSFHSAYFIIAR